MGSKAANIEGRIWVRRLQNCLQLRGEKGLKTCTVTCQCSRKEAAESILKAQIIKGTPARFLYLAVSLSAMLKRSVCKSVEIMC